MTTSFTVRPGQLRPRLDFTRFTRFHAAGNTLQAEVDALKRLQAETAAELNALLPSILDRAFTGHL